MNSRMGPRGAFLGAAPQQYHPAPNAALLIDFDNVTMTIRSDLGKEIKALLKSEVIRGKVAVQRAYADWRRYPQYIVPLTEASVDLIFAPAYGSSKKNATDLRMAIDAIELVFTRPEIGTFILMTGDSDFSSCVLKLKEYGKYVIGVGMRESSSDLLIQNCDEYYSYHSISGLKRAGEVEESKEDPWVLVRRAVQQMVKNGDVMRTDRLKQVMLDLDPGFDEKKVGYSKFSRFVSEAASKGIIGLRKSENGQYEILVDQTPEERREKTVERILAEAEAENGRRRRGGRGREERPRPDRSERAPEALTPSGGDGDRADLEDAEAAAGAAENEASIELPVEAVRPLSAAAELTAGAAAGVETTPGETRGVRFQRGDLSGAYALLQEAVRQLFGRDRKPARDGDVKRRMLEISRDFDETDLGFPKFTRFLRQAHDAEVIDLTRTGAGNYEVALPASGKKLAPPATDGEGAPARAEEAVRAPSGREERARATSPAAEARTATEERAGREARAGSGGRSAAEPAAPPPNVAAPEDRIESVAPPGAGVGLLRRGRSGRGPLAGPPPLLPGQVIQAPGDGEKGRAQEHGSTGAARGSDSPAATAQADVATTPAAAEEEGTRSRSRRGRRGRGRKEGRAEGATAEAAGTTAATQAEPAVEAPADAVSPAAAGEAPATAPTPEEAVATVAAAEEEAGSRSRRGRRGRGRGRRGGEVETPAVPATPTVSAAVPPAAVASGGEGSAAREATTPSGRPPQEAAVETRPAEREASQGVSGAPSGGRSARAPRGRRGAAAGGPPPILEGQVGQVAPVSQAKAPDSPAEKAAPRRRGGTRAAAAPAASKPATVATEPAARPPSPGTATGRGRGQRATRKPAFSASALGLPRDPREITTYLSTSYRGVGRKTAETLLERYGADLFEALQERPDEVRQLLDDRRANSLLEQWSEDYARRSSAQEGIGETPPEAPEKDASARAETRDASSRGGRGGRGRPRSRGG